MPDSVTQAGSTNACARSEDCFPLSIAQEGLWVLNRLAPESAAYNIPEAWRVKGELNIDALRKSFDALIERHETLRTVIRQKDGRPIQIITDRGTLEMPFKDFSAAENPDEECFAQIHRDARHPFYLETSPLIRVALYKLRDREHLLLVNLHHIISDAWSFNVMAREVAALYNSFRNGIEPNLPELPIQFADYAVWHRDILQGQALEGHLGYWKEHLAGYKGTLNLPLDRQRPATSSGQGSAEFFTFSKDLAAKLRSLGRANGATLYMTLLAAYKTLLHRYSGETDIVVGSPFACRDRAEAEGLIGYLVHTHALRTDLSGDPTFEELLKRVSETVVGAQIHQDVNFETVVTAIQPERSTNSHPIFQVVFGLQNLPSEDFQFSELEITREELETGTAKFDLTLLMTETSQELRLRFEYNTDLFNRETILRISKHFENLLQEIVANPNRRLSDYQFLTPDERQKILGEWAGTQSDYDREATIPELFEQQARNAPDVIALSLGEKSMTFAQLNGRANRLATRLNEIGIEPGVAVGLDCERSFDLIIGMLAILKAGGVYVPLDSTSPQERFHSMFEEAGIGIVLTDRLERYSGITMRGVTVFPVETGPNEPSECHNPTRKVSAVDPAYIMFTSGSTGTPKGTVIPHRAIVRLVRNTNYIEISKDDVFLQLAPETFDASTFEIWGSLLNGAKLVICPPGLPSFEQLGSLIEGSKITILWLTAGLFHEMVDEKLDSLKQLRFLLAGGDVLSVEHARKANRAIAGELINGYGPTENTTFSCCYRVPKDWDGANSVPIGRPIANSTAYILDSRLNPVPIGVPGELYVGGDGLSLGYLKQPGLTAEKFISNPFQKTEDAQLYKTGDLARWLPNGNIEFLGRSDEQIKIRGFRIEPGEIETVLKKQEAVENAKVLASGEGNQKSLVAYVLPKTGSTVSDENLRQHASRMLPAYMVPARFVYVERLPLTANGKVDRRALLQMDPGEESVRQNKTIVSPRTPEEQEFAAIWESLLSRKGVGINENFFELGGNSLLAMQVISRVASKFNVDMPVRVLFETPTIAGMAMAVSQLKSQPARAPLIQAIPRDRAAELLARLDTLSEEELEALLEETELKTAYS